VLAEGFHFEYASAIWRIEIPFALKTGEGLIESLIEEDYVEQFIRLQWWTQCYWLL